MQYFTKELWCAINSDNPHVRQQAKLAWKENDINYTKEFNNIKKYLPKTFVETFLSRHGFHDYVIKSITVLNESGINCCRMVLSDFESELILAMKNIQRIGIDIPSFKNCIKDNLSWGYSEFSLTADRDIKLALLCDLDIEMLFVIKKVESHNHSLDEKV